MSALMLLITAQCKKKTDVVTSGSELGGTRTITLKVSDDDSKLSVNPNTGAVGFTSGDVIYAAYNGVYAGTLTHNGSDFKGDINTSGAADGAKLTFYFLGNKTPNESLSGATSLSVSIFDQTENYPVISAGLSNEDYSSSVDTYTATLLNKCALVKFNVTNSSTYAPTIITGVNDKVTVTFSAGAAGTFANSKDRGAVKLASGNGERWAILLPQEASGIGAAYSEDLRYNGTHSSIPTVMDNGYLTNGIDVTVSNALSGFTVASETVRFFAPGNLKYIGSASTPYWKFADNQYDCIGTAQGNSNENADRDLFGWGTSGYDGKYPYMTSTTNSNYTDGTNANITGTNYDWGVYNSSNITNGYGKSWYTLASWGHVLTSRSASTINGTADARFGRCTVAGRYGIMIFPDTFTWPVSVAAPTAENINGTGAVSIGTYTAADWTLLEANGAVFLPAAGGRDGTSVDGFGSRGDYWSTSAIGTVNAYRLIFNSDGLWYTADYHGRYYGLAVRLVCE